MKKDEWGYEHLKDIIKNNFNKKDALLEAYAYGKVDGYNEEVKDKKELGFYIGFILGMLYMAICCGLKYNKTWKLIK